MQSRGHVNDTIVVNQPRLTTDDELIQTNPDEVEMTIVTDTDGNHKFVLPDQVLEQSTETEGVDTKMYISELKEHVILQGKGATEVVTAEEGANYGEEVGHLIIDGQEYYIIEDMGATSLVQPQVPYEATTDAVNDILLTK